MTAPVAHPLRLSPRGSWLMLVHPGFVQQVEKGADEKEVAGEEGEAEEEVEEEEEQGLSVEGRVLGGPLGLLVP